MPGLLAQAGGNDWWPFVVLAISVGLVIVLITVVKLHAFLALIIAAIAAGALAKVGTLPGEPVKGHWWQAVELTTVEFGVTAGKIAVVIALASIIGMCLMESGAADKVVRRFLAVFGQKRAGTALMTSGYFLSIPIFFDTFFMLLLPLARALRLRTGKDYLLYVMAICCGGTVTHSLVAPHPGPLAMAESLKLDLGLTIIVGIVVGIIPATASWLVVKWINRRMEIPLRETGGIKRADVEQIAEEPESRLPSFLMAILPIVLPIVLISTASSFIAIQGASFDRSDLRDAGALAARIRAGQDPVSQALQSGLSATNRTLLSQALPGSGATVAVQNALAAELNKFMRSGIIYNSDRFAGVQLRPGTTALLETKPSSENLVRLNRMLIEDTYASELRPTTGMNPLLYSFGEFIGNRNVALIIGTVLALAVLMRQRGLSLERIGQLIGPPLETAGVIILITSAGGAFGLMLKNAGVGDAVQAAVAGKEINLIFLSWLVAAVIRVAQGSATVAMLTTAAMVYPITVSTGLPFHPIYIFLAIGFGAMMLSWMNDSGFWVVGRLSGFTEKETLKTWTVVVSVNSLVGLLACLIGSKILPFAQG